MTVGHRRSPRFLPGRTILESGRVTSRMAVSCQQLQTGRGKVLATAKHLLSEACLEDPPFVQDVARRLELETSAEAFLAFESSIVDRWIICLFKNGRPATYGKIGISSDSGLQNELAFLRSARVFDSFDVPRISADLESGKFVALGTDAVPVRERGLSTRSLLDVTIELARLGIEHGDFAPWNVARASNRPFVFDWEAVRDLRTPGYDLLHYLFSDAALVRRRTPENFLRRLTSGTDGVSDYIAALALQQEPIDLLQSYIAATDWQQKGARLNHFKSALIAVAGPF